MTRAQQSTSSLTPEQKAPPVRLVFWETTAGCNLECRHCRRLEVSHELAKNDLNTEESKKLIDQIAETGQPVLVFSGGEPLIRPDIFELAGYAKEKNLLTALATNGTMIDMAMAQKIAFAEFDRVSASLDGADAQTHDQMRGLPGSFDSTMRGLKLLHTAEVSTQLNCTIARHNKDQIEKMIQLGEQLGVSAVHYFLLVPVGCGEQIAEEQMLDAEEVEERLERIYELEQKTELQIKATCAPHYYRILRQKGKGAAKRGHGESDQRKAALHSITKGCLAGSAVCFVSHEGQVFPCGYLPMEAGNVRKQHFRDIWQNSSVFQDLRNPHKLEGKCGHCEFKMVCSGCRARAFYEHGNFLQEEPYCLYEPRMGKNSKS
jgi:heme b synthase